MSETMATCMKRPNRVREVNGGRVRVTVAVVVALGVAEAAVLLLRPRNGIIEPAPVSAKSYFSSAELDRARDFRRPQLALYAGTLLVEAVVLVWLVRRPPARLRGPVRRPVLVAAGAGAVLSLALNAAPLPLTAVAHARAVDVGLSTQSWGAWGRDLAKAWAIGAAGAGAGAGAAIALMRRFPRGWWVPASAVAVAFGVAMTYAGPVVLDPVFNRFTKLPPGRTRSDVLALARQAGVRVGQVYEVDASRRTTAANAYVTGLGATKRVVLYDTLLRGFSRDELRLVVAHELGHVHYRDVPHGLLYLLLVTPGGLWATAQLTRRLAPAEARPGPSSLPALGLAIGVVALGVGTIGNQLSRRVEARADSFSLRITGEPEPFIAFERGIALRNVADPDPPRLLTLLLATHPPTIDRIGIARAYEQGAR
jgi:STE24 endopeptidase